MPDLLFRDHEDRIECYDYETLYSWLQEILSDETDRVTLPHIPFSYFELARELLKRDHLKDVD